MCEKPVAAAAAATFAAADALVPAGSCAKVGDRMPASHRKAIRAIQQCRNGSLGMTLYRCEACHYLWCVKAGASLLQVPCVKCGKDAWAEPFPMAVVMRNLGELIARLEDEDGPLAAGELGSRGHP